MTRRFVILLAAGALSLALLTGCSGNPTPPADTDPTTATTTTTTTTTTTAPPSSPVNTAMYNRLTGEYDNAAGADSRPVAVMVGNNDRSRPQIGLAGADMYMEAETEGGITRMLAVFADVSRIPEQLCPIRSARSPFVLMTQSLDAIYVHAGGSVAGLATLSNVGLNSVNALGNHGDTFWRDAALRKSKGLEYSLSTSGTNLSNRISALKLRDTSDRAVFTFADKVSGDACTELQVTFSRSQSIGFTYNAETGRYTKQQGKLGGAAHTDAAGTPIEVSNVVVMYDTKYAENETTISFKLTSGRGLLFAGGTVREIEWKRTASGLSFTENGQPAAFLPGKTYLCLTDKNNEKSTVTR